MTIYIRDPFGDSGWAELLHRHDGAAVFHSPGWLRALERTYNYRPLIATTCAAGADLTNGVVCCLIRSFLTGQRLVSLPFSDHCEPLAGNETELADLLNSVPGLLEKSRCKSLELRPLSAMHPASADFGLADAYYMHQIDLSRGAAEVFHGFHKDSIQRKIRRAERENLSYGDGRSEKLIREFYRLLLLTRRRHKLPPQPFAWFQNLASCLGESMKVRVAYKNGQPVASIITLRFKDTLIYKYGCSDEAHHNLGGMHMLFWRAIQEAIEGGLRIFDLGRSEVENNGLVTFKDRWGARRSLLSYWATPAPSKTASGKWRQAVAGHIFGRLPDRLLVASGKLMYKHFG